MANIFIKAMIYLQLLAFTRPCCAGLHSDWMNQLYSARPHTRLNSIALPATHDSGTSGMNFISKIAPGARGIFFFIHNMVLTWGKTQYRNLYEQLNLGVRVFDLRVSYNKKGVGYIAHGLVSMKWNDALDQIRKFVIIHPKEIILIELTLDWDFLSGVLRHDPAQRAQWWQRTNDDFKAKLGDYMLPENSNYRFQDFWSQKKSVMMLSEYDHVWNNVRDVVALKAALETQVAQDHSGRFHELAFTMTPPETDITFFMNLRYQLFAGYENNALAKFSLPIRQQGPGWLRTWVQQGRPINIVMTDFVDKYPLVDTLLEINQQRIGLGP
jgi:hypothetical protein